MKPAIAEPRKEVGTHMHQRLIQIQIDPDKIGDVVGTEW